ncbi:MAG: hypothetical protein AAFY71_12165 [Bacteroidota bacterium]
MERLFLITRNNELKYINLETLFKKYISTGEEHIDTVLYSLFVDNKNIRNISEYQLLSVWDEYCEKPFDISISENDLSLVVDLGELTILDFIMYGKKALFGCREGVFEIDVNFGISLFGFGSTLSNRKTSKIFDSKTIRMTPRLGEILVNTNSDGLFRGSFWQKQNHSIKVYEKPIVEKSLKSSWLNNDILNYTDDTSFDILHNKVKKISNEQRGLVNFKEEDGEYQALRVEKMAEESIHFDDSVNTNVNFDNVIYSFNSLRNLFSIYDDGKMSSLSLKDREYTGKPFYFKEKLDVKSQGFPLSSHVVAQGTIVEFFDSVTCIKDHKVFDLYKGESLQIKTYPNSRNYQRLVSILTEDDLSIHCIPPFKIK